MPTGTEPTTSSTVPPIITTSPTKSSCSSTAGDMKNSITGTERKQDTNNSNNEPLLSRSMSHDPTAYVQRARVTRAAPPKPATNPLQFIQIKPCQLYHTAQEQLKRAEEVKKVKEIKKEEPEDWQSNLDNWKSCRRKRVEHIIDRVVEVKKLELEEHDRTRRKSKTFSEMLEDRGTKGRKSSLQVYTEEDTNDLSDLGIGTSSASGKSSLSEDFDNQSVISDNQDIEKLTSDGDTNSNHDDTAINNDTSREYISSPGYDTSSSTAPASSPDPCEYTYEGAIQDYKTRVSRASNVGLTANYFAGSSSSVSKDSTPERSIEPPTMTAPPKSIKQSTPVTTVAGSIENRLLNFKIQSSSTPNDHDYLLSESTNNNNNNDNIVKTDMPKIDIIKRRELFNGGSSTTASASMVTTVDKTITRLSSDFSKSLSIKERLSNLETTSAGKVTTTNDLSNGTVTSLSQQQQQQQSSSQQRENIKDASIKKINRLSGDEFGNVVKTRLTNIEQLESQTPNNKPIIIETPIVSLKDRLSSLNSAVSSSTSSNSSNSANTSTITAGNVESAINGVENKKNQLEQESINKEKYQQQQQQQRVIINLNNGGIAIDNNNQSDEMTVDTDHEDSGIHTADVSCAVSQNDEPIEEVIDERPSPLPQRNPVEQPIAIAATAAVPLPRVIATTKIVKLNQKTTEDLAEKPKQQQQPPDVIPINNKSSDYIEKNIIEEQEITEQPASLIIDQDSSVIEALDLAFKAIDTEEEIEPQTNNSNNAEPIYQNVKSIDELFDTVNENENENKNTNHKKSLQNENSSVAAAAAAVIDFIEPYYQIPKSLSTKISSTVSDLKQQQQQQQPIEPLYQVPNSKPIPLYENVEILLNQNKMSIKSMVPLPVTASTLLEPPKEKPPPPPAESSDDDDIVANGGTNDGDCDDADADVDDDLETDQGNIAGNSIHTNETPTTNNNNNNNENDDEKLLLSIDAMKRMNSTKRIKKEIRNKRTSFLGIEGTNLDDDNFLELSVAPPPNMSAFIQAERQLEKQIYIKCGLYDSSSTSSDTTDSRDSGVSENHSRQSSEPLTTSSEEDFTAKKEEHELINNNVFTGTNNIVHNSDDNLNMNMNNSRNIDNINNKYNENEKARMRSLEDQIREQEEVLRVERELLQLEQEELKRQRENLLVRETITRRELDHGAKMLMSANNNSQSMHNINNSHFSNHQNFNNVNGQQLINNNHNQQQLQQLQQQQQQHHTQQKQPIYQQIPSEYRQSMPNLLQIAIASPTSSSTTITPAATRNSIAGGSLMNMIGGHSVGDGILPPIPPAKPMRSHLSQEYINNNRLANSNGVGVEIHHNRQYSAPIKHSQSIDDFVQQRSPAVIPTSSLSLSTSPPTCGYGNMSKHTLHALSAVPRPKFQDGWVVQKTTTTDHRRTNDYVNTDQFLRSMSNGYGNHHHQHHNHHHHHHQQQQQQQQQQLYHPQNRVSDQWLATQQQKRKSEPLPNFNNNKHWLVQEAEQRRIDQMHRSSNGGQLSTPQKTQWNGNNNHHHHHHHLHQHQQQQPPQQNHNNQQSNELIQRRGSNDNKPLPEAVIQTLTQRIQNRGLAKIHDSHQSILIGGQSNGTNNISSSSSHESAIILHSQDQQQPLPIVPTIVAASVPVAATTTTSSSASHSVLAETRKEVLSVSGKKKCSYCCDELGRGAAMIIESLRLFYHLDCFKCSVCRIQLGDGVSGADVRVRNQKLHCHNCFSSDDGIKFSCV